MRISSKQSIALCFASVLVIGSYGALELREETRDLRAEVTREVTLLGTAMQAVVQGAARDSRPNAVHETMAALERVEPSYALFVFDAAQRLREQAGAHPPDLPPVSDAVAQAAAAGKPLVHFTHEGARGHVMLAAPLFDEQHTPLGTVALVRPLHDVQKALWHTRRFIVASVLMLIAALVGLCYGLGSFYVGRPLQALLRGLRALGTGATPPLLPEGRRDEVGAVAVEFNRMVSALAAARAQIAHEADARRVMEAHLQRLDKLATVGQLAAGLAHEIGSPLQVLNGRARALHVRTVDPETKRYAGIFVEQTDRIAHIVGQLLRFARRSPPRLQPSDLKKVLPEVVDLVELLARRKQISLTLHIDAAVPQLLADPAQVQQIALNLLSNAIAATPARGRVAIRVTCEAPSAERMTPASAHLIVEDTGPGMDAETRTRLFEPFFTTRAQEGGSGLGLAVVHSLVQEHGGTVWAESVAAGGSRFHVLLPIEGPGSLREEAA